MLSPFYITEEELLSTYLDDYTDKYIHSARQIIFKTSLEVDRLVGKRMSNMVKEEVFAFKRQLTLCMCIIAFGNKFNKDYVTSLSRTKTLAEFTVSTTSNNSPQFVMNTINDAKTCVNDLKEALSYIGINIASTFVKGSLNGLNNSPSYRLWHHFDLGRQSQATYAATKKPYNGKYYKNGGL